MDDSIWVLFQQVCLSLYAPGAPGGQSTDHALGISTGAVADAADAVSTARRHAHPAAHGPPDAAAEICADLYVCRRPRDV